MNKWAAGIGVAALIVAAIWAVTNGSQGASEIEFRYAKAAKGELVRSTSSTGTLVPLTKVDVKSKAGGKVMKLLVEEGTPVVAGQTIALIDPEDTKSTFQQAEADVTTAMTRVAQARTNAAIESKNSVDRVKDAEIALNLSRLRLSKAEQTTRAQPVLSRAELNTALANLETAREALRTLRDIEIPQTRRDAQGQYDRAKADLDANEAEMRRQENLLEYGYVAQSAVERQRSTLEASRAAFRLAEQRLKTLNTQIDSQTKTAEARVRQADQTVAQARANQNQIPISAKDFEEARNNVRAAEVALSQARTQLMNTRLRSQDVVSAQAGAVRSQVAKNNAMVQLQSTTVVAPRTGIVTLKYLEEGTIIPPGTSTFAQGTSLVQIADTTTMFVECAVDETDIGSVRIDQPVRLIVEAYPGQSFDGVVKKIFPAAETANALTTVKVRVQVVSQVPRGDGGGKSKGKVVLRPGMNASCEFLAFIKKDVLIIPQQAVNREGGKVTVKVKSNDPKKPTVKEVKVGESGNDGVEVLEGLSEGDEVVIAEIDLRAMRDRQAKMEQVQQGGGFGSQAKGGPSQSRATSGGGGGSKGGGK